MTICAALLLSIILKSSPRIAEAAFRALSKSIPQAISASSGPVHLHAGCLSYDFSREQVKEEPLGEGYGPLVSGGGRIGRLLAVERAELEYDRPRLFLKA